MWAKRNVLSNITKIKNTNESIAVLIGKASIAAGKTD
jgi:hypothetical protein